MGRALIVIDIQNDYFTGGVLPLVNADEVEKRTAVAIERAREDGDRIILIQHISTEKAGLFAAGGTGIDIRPAILAAAGSAPIVIKHFADSFQETDLASHLSGIDTLLICGMMTQNCVVFTAMSKDAEAFDVTVIGDLCAAPLEVVNQIALGALGSKLRVVNIADIWA